MRAGTMRTRIELQEETRTPTPTGGATLVWTTVARPWARVRALSMQDRQRAEQLESVTTHEVALRYRADVTAARHRVRIGARILKIEGVGDVDERHRETVLQCREVAA